MSESPSSSVLEAPFRVVEELTAFLPELVRQSQFGLVVTIEHGGQSDIAGLAERLTMLRCIAVYCRGRLKDELEYAIDMACVAFDLSRGSELSDSTDRLIITASGDDDVESCVEICRALLRTVGPDAEVVVIANQV